MARHFYHATDDVFDRFDPAFQGTKGASNGHLGVWVGNEMAECEMFGDVLMTLSIDRDIDAYAMDYEEFRRLHDRAIKMSDADAAGYWKGIASRLMDEGTRTDRARGRSTSNLHSCPWRSLLAS